MNVNDWIKCTKINVGAQINGEVKKWDAFYPPIGYNLNKKKLYLKRIKAIENVTTTNRHTKPFFYRFQAISKETTANPMDKVENSGNICDSTYSNVKVYTSVFKSNQRICTVSGTYKVGSKSTSSAVTRMDESDWRALSTKCKLQRSPQNFSTLCLCGRNSFVAFFLVTTLLSA